MRVLLIEDDPETSGYIRGELESADYEVDLAAAGEVGIQMSRSGSYDIVLLDVGLPDMSGFDVAARLRRDGYFTPIVMLTARASTADIVQGLEAGADGYLTKPFSSIELLARLRALVRRDRELRSDQLRFADLEVDRLKRTALRAGIRIRLTPTEFKLIEELLVRPGDVVSRSALLRAVWEMDFDPGTNVLDVHLSRLRGKLEAGGRSRLIHNVKDGGFLVAEVDPTDAAGVDEPA